jgi:hypothetical protein
LFVEHSENLSLESLKINLNPQGVFVHSPSPVYSPLDYVMLPSPISPHLLPSLPATATTQHAQFNKNSTFGCNIQQVRITDHGAYSQYAFVFENADLRIEQPLFLWIPFL